MYSVLFVRRLDAKRPVAPGTILIAPSPDSWNDFGQRVRTEIAIFPKADWDGPLRLTGFIGFLEKKIRSADARFLAGLLDNQPNLELAPEGAPPFFTMLPDMGAYREIVGALGPSEAMDALKAMRDMVAFGSSAVGQVWFRDAQQQTLFQTAFLRSSESYVAWKNAATLLRGLEFEEAGILSDSLSIEFTLAGRPNPHQLDFRFGVVDDVLPRRFAIIIGKNGVGKSQTLGRIATAALRQSSNLSERDGGRTSINRLLAFSPTAASSSVFPAARRRDKIWYRRFTLNHPGVGRARHTTADLIVELARSNQFILDEPRLNLFLKALPALEASDELALRTNSPGEDRYVRFSDLTRGGEEDRIQRFASIDLRVEPVRLIDDSAFELSSGELAFVRFAALTSLYIENGTLLLIDEPETHLHPNFISQFVALLNSLLTQTGSAAIIATHSVYFVREAFEDQVIVLRSGEDRRIEPEMPKLRTFGADVGAISYFVFGEDEPSKLAQRVERQIASEGKSWPETFDRYKDDLSLELLGEIRADMEAINTPGDQA